MKANSNPEDISREINLAELSERESEVLLLLGTGFGGTEIAVRLELSPRTVETYMKRLKKKLGLPNNRELLRVAIRLTNTG
ncbi:hypothetical protein MASR1M12_03950 [Erysipelotrichia bacterium]